MLILNRLMMPPGLIAGALLAIEFTDNAVSGGQTITTPSGVEAGDLLILLDYSIAPGSGSSDKVIPSGFTEASSTTEDGDTKTRLTMSYKVANGAEGSLTGQLEGAEQEKLLALLRFNRPLVSASADGVASSFVTADDPPAQMITSSSGSLPLLTIGAYASTSSISPRSMTPTKDGEVGNGKSINLWLAWKLLTQSAENVEIDMGDHGYKNALIGCYLELTT